MWWDTIRKFLNARGWDLRRHRPFYELVLLYGFDLVLDVGANRGQFGLALRRHGYRGALVSFEPQEDAFAQLEEIAGSDSLWTARRIALGNVQEELDLHLYASDDFSSFKALLSKQISEVRISRVAVQRLDKVAQEWLESKCKALLKIDTQGFEREVLAGAEGVIGQFSGIIMETSLTPLYQGQWCIEEAIAWLRSRGFYPHALRRGYFEGNRDMEYDVFFLRETK